MSNSFVLLTLVSAVYAVVGVNVFGNHSPEFFHDFTQGMFTLFECTTGDGWSDIVRRTSTNALDLNADSKESGHATLDTITALYFSSYMVLSSIELVNIVIAVLLDGFLNTMAQEREKLSDALAAADDDFTLSRVMNTILDFRSSKNLEDILSNIYDQLDVDGSGSLSFQEAHAGLKKIFHTHLSHEDWGTMLRGHENEIGDLSEGDFMVVMSEQLQIHLQRKLNASMAQGQLTPAALLPASSCPPCPSTGHSSN